MRIGLPSVVTDPDTGLPTRPPVLCAGCSKPTKAAGGVCVQCSSYRAQLVELASSRYLGITTEEAVEAVGRQWAAVEKALHRLVERGVLRRVEAGRFALAVRR